MNTALKLKLKPITIRSYMFSRILCKLFCFYVCTCKQVSEFHWLFKLSSFLLIGHLDYFGFGFTIFSPVQLLHTIKIILNSSSDEYQLMASSCSVEKKWAGGNEQAIHVCEMHPGLLGRIDMNAKWTLSCWVNIHLCKMHPGLLSSC